MPRLLSHHIRLHPKVAPAPQGTFRESSSTTQLYDISPQSLVLFMFVCEVGRTGGCEITNSKDVENKAPLLHAEGISARYKEPRSQVLTASQVPSIHNFLCTAIRKGPAATGASISSLPSV